MSGARTDVVHAARELTFLLGSSLYSTVFVTCGFRQLYTLAWYMSALVSEVVVFTIAIGMRKISSFSTM